MTTEKLTIDQVERETGVDLSCNHCKGTGMAPNYTDEWLPILLEARRLGNLRGQYRYAVGNDRDLRDQAWLNIVDLWENRALPAHIPVTEFATALGVSKVHVYNGLRRAQKVKAGPKLPRPTAPTSAMRAWARENGYDVADKGYLPEDIQTAYAAAHQDAS